MDKQRLVDFADVDRTTDPHYFIRFLDMASADDSFQAYKRHSIALLDIQEGHQVLEVGCGTGADACSMATLVGAGGRVIAIDSSQSMIDEARKRSLRTGLALSFEMGNAHQLDFVDESFDRCRSDRVFMHLEDPLQALREMVRVTRSGGTLLVYEVDFETLTIDVPDRRLARTVMNTWCDGFRNGWLGRHLPALFHEVGLCDVTVIPKTLQLTYELACQLAGASTVDRARAAGLVTPGEAEVWLGHLQSLHEARRFFSTLTGFLVLGRKP